MTVDRLGLSARTVNLLRRGGVHTVGELLGHTPSDLTDLRSFGDQALGEVQTALFGHGLSLLPNPSRSA